MEITPIGWVLLPLALILFFSAPKMLYTLTIFFLPFSATAIANIGSDSSSGVQASMLFGSLWILKELPGIPSALSTQERRPLHTPLFQLGLFACIAVVSLIMPVWINGHLVIESPDIGDWASAPLHFSATHITQTLYLIYGILLCVLVANKNCDALQFWSTLRVFLVSAVFVSLWGFFQLACWVFNFEYPVYIFNTSTTESALGYTQKIQELGIQRISSVATEPSMFAQCLLVAMVVSLFALLSPRPLFSRMGDRLVAVTILGALLITTSTTAYVGLAIVFAMFLVGLWYLGKLRSGYVLAMFALGGLVCYIYLAYVPVQDVLQSMLLEKGESYSALSRVNSVLLARSYFIEYPVLGVGWGSVTSHDLIFKLLSNTGAVGLCTFALFILTEVGRLFKATHDRHVHSCSRIWQICLLATLLTVVLTNLAGDFAFTYGHTWFVFGLAMAATA
jgi:hypothetical protein